MQILYFLHPFLLTLNLTARPRKMYGFRRRILLGWMCGSHLSSVRCFRRHCWRGRARHFRWRVEGQEGWCQFLQRNWYISYKSHPLHWCRITSHSLEAINSLEAPKDSNLQARSFDFIGSYCQSKKFPTLCLEAPVISRLAVTAPPACS